MNIEQIIKQLRNTYQKDEIVKYIQLKENSWLFLTSTPFNNYACFIHLKNRFIWRTSGTLFEMELVYNMRIKNLKNLFLKEEK